MKNFVEFKGVNSKGIETRVQCVEGDLLSCSRG